MLTNSLHKTFDNPKVEDEFDSIDIDLKHYLTDDKYVTEGNRINHELRENFAGIEKHLLNGSESLYNDLTYFLGTSSLEATVSGLESATEIKSGFSSFIDIIVRFVKNIAQWIYEVFVNKVKAVKKRLAELKENYKTKSNKGEASYPASIKNLLTGKTENFKNMKWMETNLNYLHDWFGNIANSYEFLEKLAKTEVAAEDLKLGIFTTKELNSKIINDTEEFMKIVSQGMESKTEVVKKEANLILNSKVTFKNLPGNYVYEIHVGSDVKNTSPIALTKGTGNNMTELLEKAKETKFTPDSGEIKTVIDLVDKIFTIIDSKFKTPTTVSKALEKTVRETLSNAKYSGDVKKVACTYYGMLIKWIKEATDKPLMLTLDALLAAIVTCDNALES